MSDPVARARGIAEDVFFPAAAEVDDTGVIPASHFDLLADEGFYGLAAPVEIGGLGADMDTFVRTLETLSSGCVTTTFTWLQHQGVVRGLLGTERTDLRDRYLAALVRGDVRAGVAFAGAIPQPPRLWARRTAGGYILDGEAPFVSGWGLIGLLQVSARDTDSVEVTEAGQVRGGDVITGLIAPEPANGLVVEPLRLVAAQASNTVRLHFTDTSCRRSTLLLRSTTKRSWTACQSVGG